MHADSVGGIGCLLPQLHHLPCPSGCHKVRRHRLGASCLLRYPLFPHGLSRCYRADGVGDALSRFPQRFPTAPAHCPLDATSLAICVGDGRAYLPDALPLVPEPLRGKPQRPTGRVTGFAATMGHCHRNNFPCSFCLRQHHRLDLVCTDWSAGHCDFARLSGRPFLSSHRRTGAIGFVAQPLLV